jgi:hypothetical protein
VAVGPSPPSRGALQPGSWHPLRAAVGGAVGGHGAGAARPGHAAGLGAG